jgi:hypothetical protein
MKQEIIKRIKAKKRHITGLFTLRRLKAAWATFWLGHSATLHFHAKTPPHFCSPGLCYAKPLFGLQKRRKQPERYAQWRFNMVDK